MLDKETNQCFVTDIPFFAWENNYIQQQTDGKYKIKEKQVKNQCL